MISELPNARMRAVLYSLGVLHSADLFAGEVPAAWAHVVEDGWEMHPSGAVVLRAFCRGAPEDGDLVGFEGGVNGRGVPDADAVELVLGSLAFARAALRVVPPGLPPVNALFTLSEPHGDVPLTAYVTFWADHPGQLPYVTDIESYSQPVMVLSNRPQTFHYALDDEQRTLMEGMAAELVAERGVRPVEAVARVNAFWRKRLGSLYFWIGGAGVARSSCDLLPGPVAVHVLRVAGADAERRLAGAAAPVPGRRGA